MWRNQDDSVFLALLTLRAARPLEAPVRQTLTVLFIFSIALYGLLCGIVACAADYPSAAAPSVSTPSHGVSELLFSPAQLDNLMAPVALYPDPLLAQVLVAATFPEQIDEAARFLRAGASPHAIDEQPWDVSVRAVAHYPTVLDMMADNLDWTTSLGQAYVAQSTDVMAAAQRLRAQALAAGHLVTTPQMEVVVANRYIALWPIHPHMLYVPVYDPELVFALHSGSHVGPVISFGLGFALGSWLIYDCDWRRHHVYYHGWTSRRGWVHRYRPHIHMKSIYVHNRHAHVRTNRRVIRRQVNYSTLNRYRAVHRRVRYDNVRRRRPDVDRPRRGRERVAPDARRSERHHNKVIRRNVDPDDPRIHIDRGRRVEPWSGPARPDRDLRPTPRQRQPKPRMHVRPKTERRQREPRVTRPRRRDIQRRQDSVFRGGRSRIDPRAARQRGRSSRRQMQRARPLLKSPPAHRQRTPSRR